MIRKSLGIGSGASCNGFFARLMMFGLLRVRGGCSGWRAPIPEVFGGLGHIEWRVIMSPCISASSVAGRGKEVPAIAKEPSKSLMPLAISQAGGEFLQGGLPRLAGEEGLQGVSAGKA